MKYLLVSLPTDLKNEKEFYSMPLGLAYINGAMRSAGFDVEAINLRYAGNDPIAVLKSVIIEKKINVVLCGGLTIEYNLIKAVFDAAKEVNPEIITVGGGGGFSSEPILFSEMTGADYAVIGEGEITDCELAHALDHGESVDNIQGLVIKKDSGYVYTGEREYIKDLDSIPFPSYEGLAIEEYLSSQRVNGLYHMYAYHVDEPRVMPILLARSCPFLCSFCYHPIGRGYRERSLDSFFKELDTYIEKYNINTLAILDECFSIKPDRVLQFCERIKPYNLAWSCQMRVETYSEDLIQAMVDAGCVAASFGVESMSQTILDNMNKRTTVEQLKRTLEISERNRGGSRGNILFGAETETPDTISETIRWIDENQKYIADTFFIGTYPGSVYYHNSVERGLIKDKRKFIEDGCPTINMTKLSEQQFQDLQQLVALKETEIWCRGKVISVQENGDSYDAVLQCSHCGYENHFKSILKTKSSRGVLRAMGCRKCRRRSDYVIEENSFKTSFHTTKWLLDRITGTPNDKLLSYVTKNKIRRAAVYGMKYATGLIEELRKANVEIVCGVDRSPQKYQTEGFPLYGLSDRLPEMDAIFVVQVYYYKEICADLKKITSAEIISLEDVFEED